MLSCAQGIAADRNRKHVHILHLLELLVGCVVAIHVGLMMFAVVQLHDLTADDWLQSTAE